MGSGSFPLSRTEKSGEKLLEAARLVNEVIDDMRDDVYSGDSGGNQYDNAASDGGSLALLHLAVKLIEDEVRK